MSARFAMTPSSNAHPLWFNLRNPDPRSAHGSHQGSTRRRRRGNHGPRASTPCSAFSVVTAITDRQIVDRLERFEKTDEFLSVGKTTRADLQQPAHGTDRGFYFIMR
jgi:hypothetical protein